MLNKEQQVIASAEQYGWQETEEVWFELPSFSATTQGVSFRLIPAKGETGIKVSIDQISLEQALPKPSPSLKPSPSPILKNIKVTGRLTRPTIEGQRFYRLTENASPERANKSYVLTVKDEDKGVPNWNKYVGKNVTVTGKLQPAAKTFPFLPNLDRIIVSRIVIAK